MNAIPKDLADLLQNQHRSIWCQFHQHFMSSFFIQKCFVQLSSTYNFYRKKNIGKKTACKNVGEIDYTGNQNFENI